MSYDTRRRCTHCQRFIARESRFDLCADCLENAQPTDNEGVYTRIRNQFDADGRAT